jgi:hypothetical protein
VALEARGIVDHRRVGARLRRARQVSTLPSSTPSKCFALDKDNTAMNGMLISNTHYVDFGICFGITVFYYTFSMGNHYLFIALGFSAFQ